MKKIAGNDFKVVDYFGVMLGVNVDIKYLVTTPQGGVVASVNKPELDPELDWLYEWEDLNICIATVDLEGMDWKDTLMEV